MNILYVYGWNSSPMSETVKSLRELLPEHDILSVVYDQHYPTDAINFFNAFIVDHKINAIIASSYGAFIAINTLHSVQRYLINPCLRPSVSFAKLGVKVPSGCVEIENNKKVPDDEDIRFTTAFFADNDELFSYKSEYLARGYSKFFDLVGEGHRLSATGLKFVINTIK